MARTVNCKECKVSTLYISWSSLRVHEDCKQKGKLSRSGHKNPMENQRVYFPGTVTDRVVRDWLMDNPEDNLGAMPDMVDQIILRERTIIKDEGGVMSWKNPGDYDTVLHDCIEAVSKIEPWLLKYVTPFEYTADFRFKAPVDIPVNNKGYSRQVVLNGAMDILVRDSKGRYFVFDVKHTRDDYYYKKTSGQMLFYDLATEIMFGQPASMTALLQPLCKEPVKPVPLDRSTRAGIMQRIVGMANDVWEDDLPPREDNTICTWCSVRHACTKFVPVVKNGKQRVEF